MPDIQQPFLFAVKDVLGDGRVGDAVVTGRVERGTITSGLPVDIVGMSDQVGQATVTGLRMFGRPMAIAVGGDPGVTVTLDGVTNIDLACGQIIVTQGSVLAYRGFRAVVRVLDEADGGRSLRPRHRGKFFFRTVVVPGTGELVAVRGAAGPGHECEIVVALDHSVGMEEGTVFEMHGDRGIFDRFAIGRVLAALS